MPALVAPHFIFSSYRSVVHFFAELIFGSTISCQTNILQQQLSSIQEGMNVTFKKVNWLTSSLSQIESSHSIT